ncbi:hypothetical protein A3C89_03085 [Candidatus Kaiserbacteria bacterium RIFCSPHIGHO2_02_FULL_50_50]|uniref:Extracellular solute-binding protein n=1 Tax=Candidatus Kaiserbacteria bacterium RIFCSPHIGHO2_02_FULL_50_50 TaxID=1798492 RepID=A0A1F6DF01_9BACT|nr:MAG: hypothetical protein A3C89_03085 [Candidatus Kaiserbacteria bacterium RIFCSPHIGHO2_02_FULL_50_50]OGG89064.1 MAG: hypothetical protein A3G62_04000 [Candidatus Kaiserbacteria bacterium RIFCSPLOWO2_12_FULL_50_10]
MRKNIIMILKYISWMLVIGSIIGTVVYFNVYDRMTRAPLKVLWVDSPYARDLRNILDEFTDRTNISVQVDSVPRELYREAITRDLDTLDQAYDIVIGEAVWASQDISRNYYADIGDLVRDSWLFKTYSPATDGEIFVRKNGAYYGMPVALDVFGIVYAEGEPAPETLEGLTGGSLVPVQVSGELTHTFLALLVAQGGAFADRDGKLSRASLTSDVAQEVLETLRAMSTSGALPLLGRTEHLRRDAAQEGSFAPLPGKGSSVYAVRYLAQFVEGSKNPRAARALLAWLGTKQAHDFMQEENGASLVAAARDDTLSREHSATRPTAAVPVQFFTHENAAEMLRLAENYLASYRDGTTKFTAQETLETIATAWEKELSPK